MHDLHLHNQPSLITIIMFPLPHCLFILQSIINTEIEKLPVNEALLQLVGNSVPSNNATTTFQALLSPEDFTHYLVAKRCIEELALYLKPCQATLNNPTGKFSFP